MTRVRFVALLLFLARFNSRTADDLADKIRAITEAPEYKPARWGILVVDAKTGTSVYETNADKLFLPASTTKLYTCANALNEFGPDFHFITPVYRHGEVKE